MNKIRWGVLSTAKIGVGKVIPAMQKGIYSTVTAIASRSSERAREIAAHLNIPKSYSSYEDLLNDPDIDAIYNPLPNHLHCIWTVRAMEAGKHVLCEKPLGLSCEEIETLIKVRDMQGVKAGEAFMVKSHPQWKEVLKRIKTNEFELISNLNSFFLNHHNSQT